MGLVESIFSGLLGGVINVVRNDANNFVECMTGCDSWVLKAEKSLSYIAFIMGAAGPGQVVFRWIHTLLDGISIRFFGLEYDTNPLLLNGVAFILSNFGHTRLHEIWEAVRRQSLCLIFDNCHNPGLQKLSQWKKLYCNVPSTRNNYFSIDKQTGCEQFFNEIPLMVLGLVMGGMFMIVKYYKIGRPPVQGPNDEMQVQSSYTQGPLAAVSPSSGGGAVSSSSGDGDLSTQPLYTQCPICQTPRTIPIVKPTPVFCSNDCEVNNLGLSATCEREIVDHVNKYAQELMNQIEECLCEERCRPMWPKGKPGDCADCSFNHSP